MSDLCVVGLFLRVWGGGGFCYEGFPYEVVEGGAEGCDVFICSGGVDSVCEKNYFDFACGINPDGRSAIPEVPEGLRREVDAGGRGN